MANIDISCEELQELQKRIDKYIGKGLHPVHARNKARKDMRKPAEEKSNNDK